MCDGGDSTTQVDKQGLPDDAKRGVTKTSFVKNEKVGSHRVKYPG